MRTGRRISWRRPSGGSKTGSWEQCKRKYSPLCAQRKMATPSYLVAHDAICFSFPVFVPDTLVPSPKHRVGGPGRGGALRVRAEQPSHGTPCEWAPHHPARQDRIEWRLVLHQVQWRRLRRPGANHAGNGAVHQRQRRAKDGGRRGPGRRRLSGFGSMGPRWPDRAVHGRRRDLGGTRRHFPRGHGGPLHAHAGLRHRGRPVGGGEMGRQPHPRGHPVLGWGGRSVRCGGRRQQCLPRRHRLRMLCVHAVRARGTAVQRRPHQRQQHPGFSPRPNG